MKFYYVYMIKCKDDSIYIALTNDLERRICEHNNGTNTSSYAYKRRPVKLIFNQKFIQFEQAERFEEKIKKWSRKKKLSLASGNFKMLKKYSESKNVSSHKNYQSLDQACRERSRKTRDDMDSKIKL